MGLRKREKHAAHAVGSVDDSAPATRSRGVLIVAIALVISSIGFMAARRRRGNGSDDPAVG